MTIDEFAAAAMQLEHITACRVELVENWARIVVESYLANDDGSVVEHGYAHVKMTMEQFTDRRWSAPGPWLLQTFDRAIAEKWQGFVRYASPREIAQYKLAQIRAQAELQDMREAA